jgi:hypothetical protein
MSFRSSLNVGSIAVSWLSASLLLVSPSCKSKDPPAAPAAATPDRLKSNEPVLGTEKAFGIPVPRELKVRARFGESVHLEGPASAASLTEYFRGYVLVDHLELSGTETIFPRVRIKGSTDSRLFRIRISEISKKRSEVVIEDVTPAPTTPGLNEAQRWEQVGMNPDGTLKNRLQLK